MAHLSIIRPGLFTTVQDLGRWGYQSRGVPVSGALDWFSHRLANLLVGNDPTAAGLIPAPRRTRAVLLDRKHQHVLTRQARVHRAQHKSFTLELELRLSDRHLVQRQDRNRRILALVFDEDKPPARLE